MKNLFFLFLFFLSEAVFASPNSLSLQGKLVKNDIPVVGSVQLTVRITSPNAAACILYEEEHTLSLASTDNGVFSIKVGSGTPTSSDEGLSLTQVFKNDLKPLNGLVCPGGGTVYTPAANHSRHIWVTFVNGADTVAFPTPYVTASVPYAFETDRLDGKTSSEYLQTTAETTQAKINNIMDATHYATLEDLLDGTSSLFLSANSPISTSANFTQTGATNFSTGTGAISMNGPVTVAAHQNFSMASGTGTFSQNYTGTATAQSLTANSVTSAPAQSVTANGLTSGSILSLSSNSTAAANGNTGLNIEILGANGSAGITRTGISSSVTSTGSTSTNVAGLFSASGATNNTGLSVNVSGGTTNYAALFQGGPVGIGTATPVHTLQIVGTVPASGDAANVIHAVGAAGAASGGAGGGITMMGGAGIGAANSGGDVTISSGSSTSGSGGALTLSTGAGNGATGGSISITSSNFNSGGIFIKPGRGGTSASSGSLNLQGADGPTTSGTGGSVNVTGGNATANGNGGPVNIAGGNGTGTNRNGGNLIFNGGTKTGTGTDGDVILANSRGNVGIGTTSPATKLHVNGNATVSNLYVGSGASVLGNPISYWGGSTTPIRILNWNSGAGATVGHDFSLYNTSGNPASYGRIDAGVTASTDSAHDGFLKLSTARSGTMTEVVRVTSSGRVGVATSAPVAPLSVLTSVNTAAIQIRRDGSFAGNSAVLGFRTSASESLTNSADIRAIRSDLPQAGDNVLAFYNQKSLANTETMRLDGYGNVGIGTSSPNYRLDVDGSINMSAGNALKIAGSDICTASGCTTPSDRRFKENITPLDYPLEKILRLSGVQYDWKNKKQFSDSHQIGLIAQDVEKTFPEVVVTDSKTGLKSIMYQLLVAPLIESVKALSEKLAFQDEKMQRLELQNLELKSENLQIRLYLCKKDPSAEICRKPASH